MDMLKQVTLKKVIYWSTSAFWVQILKYKVLVQDGVSINLEKNYMEK